MNTYLKVSCTCGKPDCTIALTLESRKIWFTDYRSNATSMYVDKESLQKLIVGLEVMLSQIKSESK